MFEKSSRPLTFYGIDVYSLDQVPTDANWMVLLMNVQGVILASMVCS